MNTNLDLSEHFPDLRNKLKLNNYSRDDLDYLLSLFLKESLELEIESGKRYDYHDLYMFFCDLVSGINPDLVPSGDEFVNTLGMFENAIYAKDYVRDMQTARKLLKDSESVNDVDKTKYYQRRIDSLNRELLERQKLVFKYSDNGMNRRKVNRLDINVNKTLSLEDIHKKVQEIKNITPEVIDSRC